jgi:hypothetical protein
MSSWQAKATVFFARKFRASLENSQDIAPPRSWEPKARNHFINRESSV